jgi:hypothetical protein
MGKRKQATKSKEEEKPKKKETPEDVYFAHLDAVEKREKGLGTIIIQCVERPEEEEGDEGGEYPLSSSWQHSATSSFLASTSSPMGKQKTAALCGTPILATRRSLAHSTRLLNN